MKKHKGFTLIELLVVIAIIGLLSTLAVVALNNARQKSRDARRLADIKQIQTGLELFLTDPNGTAVGSPSNGYPANLISNPVTLGVAGASTVLSSAFGISNNSGGTVYMERIPAAPVPPSGNVYNYYSIDSAGDGCFGAAWACPDYQIAFSLEGDAGGLSAGPNCATPAAITSGACSCVATGCP